MPEISRFLGIKILMMLKDHAPPHFHVEYNEYRAMVAISDFAVLEGKLPTRIHAYVIEWALLHKDEIKENWELAKTTGKCFKIEPLI